MAGAPPARPSGEDQGHRVEVEPDIVVAARRVAQPAAQHAQPQLAVGGGSRQPVVVQFGDINIDASGVKDAEGIAPLIQSELADAAGYAPPSLYRYFRSKEEIFESLREMLHSEFQAIFEGPVDRAQPLAARLADLESKLGMARPKSGASKALPAKKPIAAKKRTGKL